MNYYHYSPNFNFDESREYYQTLSLKPVGLWCSPLTESDPPRSEWMNYLGLEDEGMLVKIELLPPAKIFKIDSFDKLNLLQKEFGYRSPFQWDDEFFFYDWKKFFSLYNCIEIILSNFDMEQILDDPLLRYTSANSFVALRNDVFRIVDVISLK